jgi:hexokinase
MLTSNEKLYFLFGITSGIAMASAAVFLLSALRTNKKVSRSKQVSRASSPSRTRGSFHNDTLTRLESLLSVSTLKLHEIVKHFVKEMARGLTINDSTLRMIPSHVVRRATGQEKGQYLALDLGGSNFRVCEVNLEGNGAGINIKTN